VSGNEFDERAVVERNVPDDEPSEDPSDESEAQVPEAQVAAEQRTTTWPPRESVAAGSETEAAEGPSASDNGSAIPASVEPAHAIDEAGAAAIEDEDAVPVEEDAGEDPFAGWPQPQSGVVVEDEPADGVSVEHVEGEIDVPDGYTVLEGSPLGRRRSVAVVVSRFNGGLTNRMLAIALDALEEAEVSSDAITVVPVPGAFELPLAAMALAKTRRYACVVALGAIVRGETPHFDYVAAEAASGLQLAAIETGVPVAFGVLTVETVEQGEARIDRARDAVQAALEMADLFARLRASAH
jgi:6,7-dimethyl-8-ribityllumazine synthase